MAAPRRHPRNHEGEQKSTQRGREAAQQGGQGGGSGTRLRLLDDPGVATRPNGGDEGVETLALLREKPTSRL